MLNRLNQAQKVILYVLVTCEKLQNLPQRSRAIVVAVPGKGAEKNEMERGWLRVQLINSDNF